MTAKSDLSSAEAENLVRRSYQYVALYNTLFAWALNKKSPFFSDGWNLGADPAPHSDR
jgi:predicted secreted Zn-dependent protease